MIPLSELANSKYLRCKSIYLASKIGLPVPLTVLLQKKEFETPDYAEIEKNFAGRILVIHAPPTENRTVGMSKTFYKYDKNEIEKFLAEIKKEKGEAAIITSTRTESEATIPVIFFAIKLINEKLFVEGIKVSGTTTSQRFYYSGEKDFSFTLGEELEKNAPKELGNAINKYKKELVKFIHEFGETSTLELLISKEKMFFLEAKKETTEQTPPILSVESQIIYRPETQLSGILTKAEEAKSKSILYATTPNMELQKYLPLAKAIVFQKGALLCHFALILRELKIPSIISSNAEELIGKEIVISKTGKISQA